MRNEDQTKEEVESSIRRVKSLVVAALQGIDPDEDFYHVVYALHEVAVDWCGPRDIEQDFVQESLGEVLDFHEPENIFNSWPKNEAELQ